MARLAPDTMQSPPEPPGPLECFTRTTRDGRVLRYELRVIQQPKQARACGSGPKSSADRRPVDPPPLLEFAIYEGPERKDITFSYDTNFFCYAQLEHVQQCNSDGSLQPLPNTPPVLTGMPVSSINYLERPRVAGYFLFPDLSIRHEGEHRLRFSLYEEVKDGEDQDVDDHMSGSDEIVGPNQRAVAFRMDVTTDSFPVYSAKKFPGLMASTKLSSLIAEQGCRVRVRRDVRMRRRDGKHKDNDDDYSGGRRRHDTPHQEIRARSTSQGSEYQRRLSSAGPPSQPQYGTRPSRGHLVFGQPAQMNIPPPPASHANNQYNTPRANYSQHMTTRTLAPTDRRQLPHYNQQQQGPMSGEIDVDDSEMHTQQELHYIRSQEFNREPMEIDHRHHHSQSVVAESPRQYSPILPGISGLLAGADIETERRLSHRMSFERSPPPQLPALAPAPALHTCTVKTAGQQPILPAPPMLTPMPSLLDVAGHNSVSGGSSSIHQNKKRNSSIAFGDESFRDMPMGTRRKYQHDNMRDFLHDHTYERADGRNDYADY